MEINIDFFKIEHKQIAPEQGKILIAEPGLMDQYFKRSVILLVEHNLNGTIGFVLNRMIDMSINELLPDFPEFNVSISIGGPVSPSSIHFIHTLGDIIPDTAKVSDGLYWGGNFDTLKALIINGKATSRQVRFFVGYSGWGTNQLEKELKEHSWVVSELDVVKIMTGKDDMWAKTVSQLGQKYKPWTIYPENPSLN
ncbi:MAG TPA: YqgE/AlgH family protein [Tenuifilaceae bacterium]|nr:YqgE/AlgH family protein [Tenuifilaceae bacterium]